MLDGMLAFLLLGVMLAVFTSACAASAPWGPEAEGAATPVVAVPTGTPPAAVTAPLLPTPASTQAQAARLSGASAVQEAPTVQQLLRAMVGLLLRIDNMSRGQATADGFLSAVQQTAELTHQLQTVLPEMSQSQRQQALVQLGWVVEGLASVVEELRASSFSAGPTAAQATGVSPSRPLALGGYPEAHYVRPSTAQVLYATIEGIRGGIVVVAADEPSTDDLVVVMSSLESFVVSLYQNAPILSDPDLAALIAALAATMDDLVRVVGRYAGA